MEPTQALLAVEGEVEGSAVLTPAIYDIVWSAVAFAIILWLFWRFVLPQMQKALDARAEGMYSTDQAVALAATELRKQRRSDAQNDYAKTAKCQPPLACGHPALDQAQQLGRVEVADLTLDDLTDLDLHRHAGEQIFDAPLDFGIARYRALDGWPDLRMDGRGLDALWSTLRFR